jgi:methionyl-tRNA formyltransferase
MSAVRPRLRTVLCTCGGRYGALVWRRLQQYPDLDLCGVVHSTRVLNPRFGFIRGALAQIRLSGLSYALYLFCITSLSDWLCWRRAAGTVPNGSDMQPPPVLVTRDLNAPDGLTFLRKCAPDLLVCAFFNQRLQPPALAIARRASLNIHPSLLPEGKGVDPVFQALLRGIVPLGVTVHFMTPELDSGPVLAQRPLATPPGASVFGATAVLFDGGAQLLGESVHRLGSAALGAAQPGTGSYQSWPSRAQLREFRRRGQRLLRLGELLRCPQSGGSA